MTSDLSKRLLDSGFTPGRAHLDELWDLLAGQDEKLAESAEKALLRVGPSLAQSVLERLPYAPSPQRGRLARILGKLAAQESGVPLRPQLIALLDDADAKTRRNAIIALGKAPTDGAEDALLSRWTEQTPVEHLRSIAASLGKIGGPRSLEHLKTVEHDDPELRRIVAQSALMLNRTIERDRAVEANITGSAQASEPLHVIARSRRGLEELMLEELAPILSKAEVIAPGQVRGVLEGPLDKLFGARVMASFSLLLKPVHIHNDDVPGALAAALTSHEAKVIFSTFTQGQVRYRIDWQEGGHRRGLTWMCARRVEQADASLRNDPTGSNWEVLISERDGTLRVELNPKAIDDPRFNYRTHDVPAASHPTIAAALARVAGVKEHDVVWDPFLGSGLELCERAKLGSYQKLYGTDIDPVAIEAARANLSKAGIEEVTLVAGDSRQQRIAGLSLVISNPPMGRRVARREGVESLLMPMIDNIASQLVPGGRLVWLSPLPDATAQAGERAGLSVRRGPEVDMGGFWTELQVMTAERSPQRRPITETRGSSDRGGRTPADRGGFDRGPSQGGGFDRGPSQGGGFDRGPSQGGGFDRGGRGPSQGGGFDRGPSQGGGVDRGSSQGGFDRGGRGPSQGGFDRGSSQGGFDRGGRGSSQGGGFDRGPSQGGGFDRGGRGPSQGGFDRGSSQGGGFDRGSLQGGGFDRGGRGPSQGGGFDRGPSQGGGFNRGPSQGGGFNRGSSQGGFDRGPAERSGFDRGPSQGGGFDRGPSQGGFGGNRGPAQGGNRGPAERGGRGPGGGRRG